MDFIKSLANGFVKFLEQIGLLGKRKAVIEAENKIDKASEKADKEDDTSDYEDILSNNTN